MKTRIVLAALLVVLAPPGAEAAKKKTPLTIEVVAASAALPLVTMTASDDLLAEVAQQLAAKLGTTIDVSDAARDFRVTAEFERQPLELALRELAPQAYIDGVLTGRTGHMAILAIHLRSAGEPAPALDTLRRRTSETFMFSGHTEDPALDPFEGHLDVSSRNGRLRLFAKRQPVSVVVARLAEVLEIPFELVGDAREMIDASVTDATLEQVMSALPPSVRLTCRKDLATLSTIPVRLIVEEPAREPATRP